MMVPVAARVRRAAYVILAGLLLGAGCSSPGASGSGSGSASGSGGAAATGGSAAGAGGMAPGAGGAPQDAGGITGSGGASAGGSGEAGASGRGGGGALVAPACVDAVDSPVTTAPVEGTFSGDSLRGEVCRGGAYAFMFKSIASGQVGLPALTISTSYMGDPTAAISFAVPSNATSGYLSAAIQIPDAHAGAHSSATSCGTIALSATLAAPTDLDCNADPASFPSCPPGCELGGPMSRPTCTPMKGSLQAAAAAPSDCFGGTQTALGSWTLTLDSDAQLPDPGPGGVVRVIVHGTLQATLVTTGAGADGSPVSLSLGF